MMNATAEHYSREAERLLTDEVLAAAFETVRLQALTRLAELDPRPENIDEIRRQQAMANCLQEVRDALFAAITSSGKHDGGFNPNGPAA